MTTWNDSGDTENLTVFLGAKGCMLDLRLISKSRTCKQRKRRFRIKISKKFWNQILPSLCYKRREKIKIDTLQCFDW